MTLAQKLKPTFPNLSLTPNEYYLVDVHTDDGIHQFGYIETNNSEIEILFNDREFFLPENAKYVGVGMLTTKYHGKKLVVNHITPIEHGSSISREELYSFPNELTGKWIPEVQPDDEVEGLFNDMRNFDEGFWFRIGEKMTLLTRQVKQNIFG